MIPLLTNFEIVAILDELKAVVEVGFSKFALQRSPHLTLLSKEFYQ
jgi:hypothetical protein